jgi:hypothetical protein
LGARGGWRRSTPGCLRIVSGASRRFKSQTAALRELAFGRGLLVAEDLVFEDEGVSGAVLRRPELERLRDLESFWV